MGELGFFNLNRRYDLNAEPYTENFFRQLVVAIESTALLGGLGQLKDHGRARTCSRDILWSALFGGGPSRMSFRWGCRSQMLPVLSREAEGKQRVAILDQALDSQQPCRI